MTVRYKSATLDEFIEHHSHDVSRGGMYIKTPSPFPPGTLLKFEVRIADEQRVMQGVGRVVWKRETVASGPETPAGMGVKFIKLDDESKKVIDRLVSSRGERDGAYDHGDRPSVTATPQSTSPAPEQRQIPIRKGTMIGLGTMKAAETPSPGDAAPFFPEGPPPVQPAPEDQTVMRQAAELLRDALREAGGSIDDVMGPAPTAAAAAPPSEKPASTKPAPISNPPVQAMDSPAESRRPSPVAPAPSSRAPAPRASVRPPVSRPPYSSAPPPAKKSGGSAVGMVLGVAAVGGLIFYFAQRGKPTEEPTPAATTSATAVTASAAPSAEATPPAPSASAEASAEPATSAAPSASAAPEETPAQKAARLKAEADAEKQAAADAKKAAADAKKAAADEAKKAADEERKAAADAKKAAADEARRQAALVAAARPAPKPAAPKPAPTQAAQAPAEAPAAPTSAPAEKPDTPPVAAAPTSAPAEKPAAPVTVEKPAPAPQPTTPKTAPKKSDDSDNPY